jgi:hypothetical protein
MIQGIAAMATRPASTDLQASSSHAISLGYAVRTAQYDKWSKN